MFGFGRDDDDLVEEIVELEILETLACGNCRRGTRCRCSGRNHLGELLQAEMEIEIIEDLFG
jgi:hypothetical protein